MDHENGSFPVDRIYSSFQLFPQHPNRRIFNPVAAVIGSMPSKLREGTERRQKFFGK